MSNLNITWQTILVIFGGIATIGAGVTWISKAISPISKMRKDIDKHQALLDNDNKRLLAIEEGVKVQSKALLALIDHNITNNSIDRLREVKSELQEYLINR